LTQEIIGLPFRVGYPTGIEDLPEDLKNPAYATSLGIPLWIAREQRRAAVYQEKRPNSSGGRMLFERALNWLQSLFMNR
jgi:hypothetical protein